MARYSLNYSQMTTAATADNASLTTLTYGSLGGGSATQQLKINEVQCGGEASSAAVQALVLGRDSTVAATSLTSVGMSNQVMDGTSTAPGTLALFSNTSTTKPVRLSNGHLLNQSFNAFGGLVRWQARQGEEITTVGTSGTNFAEVSYSGTTGTVAATVSWHIIYEVV
jgi:hypothetical protein